MILLPLMAGAGFLALMLAGGKKAPKVLPNGDIDVPLEDKKTAVKAVTKAAEKKDWPAAIASALASGSGEVISALAKRLEKEGLTAQAKDIRGAFLEMQQLARNAQKPKKSTKKADKKPAKVEEVKPAKPAPKPAAKPAPKPAPKPLAKPAPKQDVKVKIGPAKMDEPTGAKKTALDMREMLIRSKRYSEDKALVMKVQKTLGLTQDGKYGPGTAKAQWDKYQIVPANPYYWPANNTAQTVSTYKAWLTSLKPRVSASEAATIDKLLPTVGR